MTVRKGQVKSVSPHADKSGNADGEQDEAVSEDGCDEVEEEVKVNVIRDPGCPSREEMERHYVTHMPFRSWCPICVQGKGKENPHYRKKDKVSGDKPTVAMDYKSFGETVSYTHLTLPTKRIV